MAMKKEEFEELINSIKGKVNETDSALISEDLLGIVGNYYSACRKAHFLHRCPFRRADSGPWRPFPGGTGRGGDAFAAARYLPICLA